MHSTLNAIWTENNNGNKYTFARKHLNRFNEKKLTFWLIDQQERTIGYICFLYDPSLAKDNTYRFVLESIQVRDGFQGRGLAKLMIDAVQRHFGETMYCTGSFTPQGHAALAGYLPVVDQGENNIEFDDMSFIHNWNKAQTARGVS